MSHDTPPLSQKNKDSKNNGSHAKYSKSWNAIDYTSTISNTAQEDGYAHVQPTMHVCVRETKSSGNFSDII